MLSQNTVSLAGRNWSRAWNFTGFRKGLFYNRARSCNVSNATSLLAKVGTPSFDFHLQCEPSPNPISTEVSFYTEEDLASIVSQYKLPSTLQEDLKSKLGQTTWYYPPPSSSPKPTSLSRLLLVSLGKRNAFQPAQIQKAAFSAFSALSPKKLDAIHFNIPSISLSPTPPSPSFSFSDPLSWPIPEFQSEQDQLLWMNQQWIDNLVRACYHASYKFDHYLSSPSLPNPNHITLNLPDTASPQLTSLQTVANETDIIMRAQRLARDLGNERANIATPEWYEHQAHQLVSLHDQLSINVIQDDQLISMGLNLIHAVGQGAESLPRLVIIEYMPSSNPNLKPDAEIRKIALVGKGITFDTGGFNMKRTGSIEDMYMDNCGAAVVLSMMQAVSELNYPIPIVGILALAENTVSAKAILPSSIIKSYQGKTVEITNTDAEGRLVLADALSYVQKHHQPTHVIDLATLTGACLVALGDHMAGLFTNNNPLGSSLHQAGRISQELNWPLPITPSHHEWMEGSESDLRNSAKGSHGGGSSTAAAFLSQFIDEEVKWAHLDIAGPSKIRTSSGHTASGYGVQLLCQWLKQIALQFPDSFLKDSSLIFSYLRDALDLNHHFFILADTSYGACCVDEVAAEHVEANAIVHYGRACLTSNPTLPVLYVFGKLYINRKKCSQAIRKGWETLGRIILIYDVMFDDAISDICKKINAPPISPSDLVCSRLNLPQSCTCLSSPNTDHGTVYKILGREFILPKNREIEDYTIIFIGQESALLTSLMMQFNKIPIWSYDDEEGLVKQGLQINRSLMKRLRLIEKSKQASLFGIVIATLTALDHLQIMERMKRLIIKAGKKHYIFSVGKINVPKLANFSEIDIFIVIACPENSLFDSSEYFRPCITPFEAELALDDKKEWTGCYTTDYNEILKEEDTQDKRRCDGKEMEKEMKKEMEEGWRILENGGNYDNLKKSERASNCLVSRHSMDISSPRPFSASEAFLKRTFQGLQLRLGLDEPHQAVKGQSGIASQYDHEK